MSYALYLDTEDSNVERSGYLDQVENGTLRLTTQVNGRGELSFKMRGPYTTLQSDLVPGLGVQFQQPAGTVIFGGVIDTVTEREVNVGTSATVVYDVRCISYASWLDRRIVRQVWRNQTVGTIIDNLLETWIGSGSGTDDGFTEGTITAAIHNATIPLLESIYKPASAILENIAKVTTGYWSVSPTKVIDIVTEDGGSAIADRNLILTNQGFEDGDLTGWSAWGAPTTRTVTSGSAWEGTYKYNHAGNGTNTGSYRNVSVSDGNTYTVSVYIKCSITGCRLQVEDASQTLTSVATDNDSWTRHSVTITADGDVLTVRIGGAGTGTFDAAQVEIDPMQHGATAYTITDATPRDIHGIVIDRDRQNYFNQIYVISHQKRTDSLVATAGTPNTFYTPYIVIAPPVVSVLSADGSSQTPRRISDDFDTKVTLASQVGQAFTGQPPSQLHLRARSSSAFDTTQTLICIGSGPAGETANIVLNGTTWVTDDAGVGFTSAVAFKITNTITGLADDCAGALEIQAYEPIAPTATPITSIPAGNPTAGVYSSITNGTGLYIKPQVKTDTTPYTNDWGIQYTDTSGGTNIGVGPLDGTNYVFGAVAVDVEELYLGDIGAGVTVTLEAQYEWEYTIDSKVIQQNTNVDDAANSIVNAIGTGNALSVQYHGLLFAEEKDTESSEVTARATAEGGTGLYEHVESVDEQFTAAEAAVLSADMIDYYSRDGATSYFPRLNVSFLTWDSAFRNPGDRFSLTLPKHAISAQTVRISQVDQVLKQAIEGGPLQWEYRVKAVTGRVYGDWAARFKAMLPWSRRLYTASKT